MNAETNAPSGTEVFDEATKWGVGGGILLTALAPLSLPIVILTVVALLPLAVPVLALALVAGVVALPVMLVRKLVSRVRKVTPAGRGPQSAPRHAASA
jgi:membrane protein implicated in regulation of membrane protease activity